MKKISLVLAVVIMTALAASAELSQSVVATLTHGSTITTFAGGNALRDAHEAAVDGDAIVLSPGTFNAVNITKAITLRGAGAAAISLPNLPVEAAGSTYITGDMSINIESTTHTFTIEGCQFNNKVSFIKAPATSVFKTRIAEVPVLSNDVASINFTHCMVFFKDSQNRLNEHTSMLNTAAFYGYYFNPFVNATNCMITGDRLDSFSANGSVAGGGQLMNCIILFPYFASNYGFDPLSANCVAYYCIACCKNAGSSVGLRNFFINSYNGTNKAINDLTMFNSENAVPSYPFYMTEEAQTQYLGNDGTQIGIHGGPLPMDPIPDNLLVTSCNIASKTTADGKLSVEIKVSTAK